MGFIDNDAYATCADAAACVTALTGLQSVSANVGMALTGTASAFTGTAASSTGTGTTFTWNTEAGGLQ